MIPIDILIPNINLHQREIIVKEFKEVDKELSEITVLEDLAETTLESK